MGRSKTHLQVYGFECMLIEVVGLALHKSWGLGMVTVCSCPALSSLNSTDMSEECFKRWNDVLDPAIDRSPWTREEDRILLIAIGEYGRAWKMIVDTYFPGRTGLDAKNRYVFSDFPEKELRLIRSDIDNSPANERGRANLQSRPPKQSKKSNNHNSHFHPCSRHSFN